MKFLVLDYQWQFDFCLVVLLNSSMGSTFGKVRKYNLNQGDDSTTPLKYSPVPEHQIEPSVDSSALKPCQHDEPQIHDTPIKKADEPFIETTPNYGQFIPDRLRKNVNGLFIPRTSSATGHLFSPNKIKDTDPASHSVNLNTGTNPNDHTKKSFDLRAEQTIKPEQKLYSTDDVDKLLEKLRSRRYSQGNTKRDSPSQPSASPGNEPCKYCKAHNPLEYRGQYVLETEPVTPGTVMWPTYSDERRHVLYTPTGKHYHLIEVSPQPYLTSDPRPLHNIGHYNVLKDTARPNLIGPVPSRSGQTSQISRDVGRPDTMQEVVTSPQEVNTNPQQRSNTPAQNKHNSEYHHKQNQTIDSTRRLDSLNHERAYRTGIFGQPIMQSDIRTGSLPHRHVPHRCYTIPEENITWPPPLHHSQSFHQVRRGGYRN